VIVDEGRNWDGVLRLQGVGVGVVVDDDGAVQRAAGRGEVLDKPAVPGVAARAAVEPVREQLAVGVKAVEHEGRVLLKPRGEDDDLEAAGRGAEEGLEAGALGDVEGDGLAADDGAHGEVEPRGRVRLGVDERLVEVEEQRPRPRRRRRRERGGLRLLPRWRRRRRRRRGGAEALEPRGDGAALARGAEDGEAGEELEEAAPARADRAVDGGRDGGGRGGDGPERAPAALGGRPAALLRARAPRPV
jgi:hypothetical protein